MSETAIRVIEGTEIPAAGSWVLDPAHTTVGFVARHLMFTKVRGEFTGVSGSVTIGEDLTNSTVEVHLDAASVTTGTEDRDAHLRSPDFLDVDNFKEIVFRSTSIELDGTEGKLHGELTVRGETRPLTLDFDFQGLVSDPWGNTKAAFSASGDLTREDWGLTWNVPLADGGVLVSKKIKLEIDTQLAVADA